MFKTIFQRFFWTSAAIIILVVTLASASMFGLLNRYILSERLSSATKASHSIEYITTEIDTYGFDSQLRLIYNSTLASWSMMIDADITVVGTNGSIFAETKHKSIPANLVERVLSGETIKTNQHSNNHKPLGYIIGIPIKNNDDIVGATFYSYPPGIRPSTIKEFSHMIFLSLLLAMIIALCLVYIESLQLSKPLKKLNTAVLEIASGKFDKRVEVTGADEIAQLASSFNYMADSLSHLEKMRSDFVSDISHELRTPMTSISGFVAGILDGTIPKEKQNDYLELVLDEATRLSKLTNEMFEMTKMTSKGYKLSIKQFDFAEITRLCIIGAEQQIDKKHLDLDVNFESEAIKVLADPDAIKRVVLNLLDNAIKFAKEGSTIEISLFTSEKSVIFEISNIGLGISKEDLPHIFDRFYKSDKSRNREQKGAGLGLSFVKNILDLHSQKITVTSKDYEKNTKKTTFTFTLEKA